MSVATPITHLQSYPLQTSYRSSSHQCSLSERTVGVISRNDALSSPGYNLFSKGKETYLMDNDGRVVHSWRSSRNVFVAYLLEDGNLLRDGSENIEAELFKAGGAAGYVELVSWDNEILWCWSAPSIQTNLTHHDLEPLPDGGCLVLCWQRRTKEECLKVGRSTELLPDGEVWDDHILELRPDGKGGAVVVWRWKLWDHLCQNVNPALPNYVENICDARHRIDINRCPVGGKQGSRDRSIIQMKNKPIESFNNKNTSGMTGEKDWVHTNAVSYSARRDAVLLSFCSLSEIIVVSRVSGDIVWRWGNAQNWGGGSRLDQRLFCTHAAHFLDKGSEQEENILLFNNGRRPDRHWSSVDELRISLPSTTASAAAKETEHLIPNVSTEAELSWTFGPPAGHQESFYCTHISSVQRLPQKLGNGNTLVTMGPQGIVFEITAQGEEVFRYISPALTFKDNAMGGAVVTTVRQGEQRPPESKDSSSSLFCFRRYPPSHSAFNGRALVPGRYLEG